ncbi:hypothetical protein ANTQUA_LOCUS9497 [Anthophora quadrimaculata]
MKDVVGEASSSIPSSNAAVGTCSNNNNTGTANNNGKASSIGAAVDTANGAERISAAVTKVLQGYDWTLVPVATKFSERVPRLIPERKQHGKGLYGNHVSHVDPRVDGATGFYEVIF